jgi:hypothetical protein
VAALDHAFFEAFSRAIGQAFLFSVVTTVLAGIVALALRELPLRTTAGRPPAEAARATDRPAARAID